MNAEVVPAGTLDRFLAVTGSGGSGALTTGQILMDAVAAAGFYGLLTRSVGPQIRGGESAALLRFGPEPIQCPGDRLDLLVGLDWLNVERFAEELPLDANSLILADPAAGAVPAILLASGAQVREVPFKELVAKVAGGRVNMVALGVLGGLVGLPLSALQAGVRRALAGKGDSTTQSALECVGLGYEQMAPAATVAGSRSATSRWMLSGNEAAGLGALRGGVRFVAAYPITPASEILEWLAPRLPKVGGQLLQAEDELASINMIIGASFGGVPSLTATSGPGLSLMLESLGLAVASETPLVVVNVMRGGPSTGIPTKTEQGDLNVALHGMHGDAPHLVLAPLSVVDCAFTTQWAVGLAEHLQAPVILLSDQFLGQSRVITDAPEQAAPLPQRRVALEPGPGYQRYALTPDGISPMTLPGTPGGMYTADGLEHGTLGHPSSRSLDHRAQMDKRRDKLLGVDWGDAWGRVEGDGPLVLVTWGSSAGALFEAASRLRRLGIPTRAVALRLLAPLPCEALAPLLADAERLWVVELNQGAQLFHWLRAHALLPALARSHARPGPLALRAGEIVDLIRGEAQHERS